MTTFDRHGLASVHVAGEHRSRPLLSRKCVVDPSSVGRLSASVPSFLLPSGQYATCHRVLPFLPPALGHYAVQTAHVHNKQEATGVRWLWWTAAPSTSPETRGMKLDQSILTLVNIFQKSMRKGAIVAGRVDAPPARYCSASAGRSFVGQNRQQGGRH